MKKIFTNQRLKKNPLRLLALGITLLLLASPSFAEDFTKIKIFPEHVGVFTSVGEQQFMAFGYRANGSTVNITNQVDWESSDTGIVQIDDNGLAVLTAAGIQIVKSVGLTRGKVTIACTYPKTTPVIGPNHLLLGIRPAK